MRHPSPQISRIAALSLAACLSVYGQGLAGSQSGGNSSILTFRVPGFAVIAVTDAPYSGRTTDTITTTRPDGTRMTRSIARDTVWRDSKGRVRTEQNRQNGPAFVYIDDPVTGYSFVLSPLDHIAHRAAIPRVIPYTGSNPAFGMVGIASCNLPITDRLGTKEISGIKAMGILSTTFCPAGSYQGNDKPFAITKETWRSDDYNLNFLVKNVNPENNSENTTTIEDFKAVEPDPSLFGIPPEYTVVDENAPFTITLPAQPGRGGDTGPPRPSVRIQGPDFGATFGLSGNLPIVKAAPYSGREDAVQDRTMADGTHFHQDQGGNKVWRDSAGKVRTEYTDRQGGKFWTLAEIEDSSGYAYVLDPWNRIAHRFPIQVFQANDRTRRAQNLPEDDAAYPSTGTNFFGATVIAEKLGTRTMSGVEVTGYRATATGPGAAKNQTMNEVWEYAPYRLALMTKDSTPMGIVRTTTIEDFSPKEPDPSLFKIPDGYRIVDETGQFTITVPDSTRPEQTK